MQPALLLPTVFCLLAPIPEPEPADKKVDFRVYPRYFESNRSGLKGDSSYLFFPNKAAFDNVLRLAPPVLGGAKATPVPDSAFTEGAVFAVIKRGPAITEYEIKKLTLGKGGVLVVSYTAKAGAPGTARFASPLVVSVDRKDVKAVEFVENGKAVKKVEAKR